ncbi:MAG: DUF5723 family protein [Bacteroidota bacterium]|nr:DUF5723 family protein [Bacteroidota bacterium]
MKRYLSFLFLVVITNAFSQDFLGLQTSNYAGVLGAYSNPANIVDGRFRTDIVLAGFNVSAENNYVGVKRSAIKLNGFGFDTLNWNNTNKNSPDYWRNNITSIENSKNKSIYASARIVLPSFLVPINRKNAVAFNWSLRNYVNLDGVSPSLAKLALEEFKYPNLWVTDLQNKALSIQQMSWAEYGFSYAHVFKEDGEHYLKAGATVKLLQGLTAAYMYINDLNYNLFTKDTISIFKSDIAYGHSDNFDFRDQNNIKYKFTSYPGVGFDIGGVYEWRPDFEKYKYEMDGEKGLWRNDKNKYKLKASFAIVDIGGIRFRKGSTSNDFTADISYWNLKPINIGSVAQFDSLMTVSFGSKASETTFKMALPTAINANVDYHIWKPFYVNLMAHITNFMQKRESKVHDFTNISLAPRFDHKWFGFTLPLTYNTLAASRGNAISVGTMLRLGPLVIGTNNLPMLLSKDVYGANLYALLKIPIPYGPPRDKDKDNISDKKDLCKDVPGVWEFMGCPDKDGDHIPDKDDKCPEVAGVKELQGCPDKDGDGITDAEDACPDDKGLVEFKGCPDKDGDKIIDKDDECPDDAGIAEFMGCPDKDGDGTPDKMDACPDVFGPKEYKGCPDKDGDGILDKEDACVDVAGPKENKGCPWPDTDKDGFFDKDDACPTTPGVAEFKGCPPPPPMKEAEKKILERAFESLEFASAKDIIKTISYPSLNDLAKLLVNHKGDWKLKLSGHTDNQGDAAKNMLLSEKRSKAVKAYLVKKGVPADNILTEWFGQTMPIADNSNEKGRQKNRRVEMKIIFKE